MRSFEKGSVDVQSIYYFGDSACISPSNCHGSFGAMFGLEVVGIVASIISAFVSSASLFREWREKRRERRKNDQNSILQISLSSGSSQIQGEYEQDFSRLGSRFAVGDGRRNLLNRDRFA